MKTEMEVSLNSEELDHIKEEVTSTKEFENVINNHHTNSISMHQQAIIPNEASTRYQFSSYILDPDKYRFTKVIRVVAYIMKFITNLKKVKANITNQASTTAKASNQINEPTLTESNLTSAADYFGKATLEVKHFVKESQYSEISREKDGKLIYVGRNLLIDS